MQKSPTEDEPIMDVKQLAKKMRVTILRKGPVDIVSDGAASKWRILVIINLLLTEGTCE